MQALKYYTPGTLFYFSVYFFLIGSAGFINPLTPQEIRQRSDDIELREERKEVPGKEKKGQYQLEIYRPLWEVGAGIITFSLPHYVGSDQNYMLTLPIPYFVYRGEFLRLGREERSGILYKGTHHHLDISLGGSPPVDSDDNEARQGMSNLPLTGQLGPRWNFTPFHDPLTKLGLSISWRKAYALDLQDFREAGNITELDLVFDWYPDRAKSWRVYMTTGPIFADKNYFNFFYRVREDEATPTRPAWRAKSGYGSWDLALALSKRFNSIWIGGIFSVDYLKGTVIEDSPLVRQKVSWAAALAFTVRFRASQVKVKRKESI